MSRSAPQAGAQQRTQRSRLRLLRGHGESHPDGSARNQPRHLVLHLAHEQPREAQPVLLAGADAGRRAALRAELGATLKPQTRFTEAGAVFEVLERAPTSRLVVLAGDLDDTSAETAMHVLAQRHPQLPVISVAAGTPVRAGDHG